MERAQGDLDHLPAEGEDFVLCLWAWVIRIWAIDLTRCSHQLAVGVIHTAVGVTHTWAIDLMGGRF